MPDKMEVIPPKPGYKTSEMWITLLGLVLSALVAAGVLTPQAAEELASPLTQTIMGLGVVVVNAALAWRYLEARTRTKAATPMAVPARAAAQEGPP